jgi:hypothetical protein
MKLLAWSKMSPIEIRLRAEVLFGLALLFLLPGGSAFGRQPLLASPTLCLYGQMGLNLTGLADADRYGPTDVESRMGARASIGLSAGRRLSHVMLLSYERRVVDASLRSDRYMPEIGHSLPVRIGHTVTLQYVTASYLLRYEPASRKPHVFVGIGPEIGLAMATQDRVRWEPSGLSASQSTENIMDWVAGFDLAARFEVGVRLPMGPFSFVPNVSYTLGFTSIQGDDGRVGGTVTGLGDAKHRVLGMSLGVCGRARK